MDNRSPKPSAKREDEFTRNAFPALSMKDVCSISNGFLCIVFEIFTGFTKTSCSDEIYFISYVCSSCFIVGEDDSGKRGSVRGRQCNHHALGYTIMTMNTNACRNVHNYVTYIKYINRAIMIMFMRTEACKHRS